MKNKKDFDKEQEEQERKRREQAKHEGDSNRDPISGEPGAHPVGVAAGGTGGAVAGAAVGGAIGGPIGAAIGGVVGAVAGGAAGKLAAEAVNPTEEDRYWRENYKNRPYYKKGKDFNQYESAYRFGWESASRPEYANRNFEDIESNLQTEWPSYRGNTQNEWSEARHATKDAFDRVRTRLSGVEDDQDFNQFEPASRFGRECAFRPEFANQDFEDIEPQLQREWPNFQSALLVEWVEIREATRDAFNRARNRGSESLRDTPRTGEGFGREASESTRNAGEYARDKSNFFWEQVKGNWKQFKGAIKEKWNELTDDEIDQMEGRKERIIGKIQEKYGENKWKEADIERELRAGSDRRS